MTNFEFLILWVMALEIIIYFRLRKKLREFRKPENLFTLLPGFDKILPEDIDANELTINYPEQVTTPHSDIYAKGFCLSYRDECVLYVSASFKSKIQEVIVVKKDRMVANLTFLNNEVEKIDFGNGIECVKPELIARDYNYLFNLLQRVRKNVADWELQKSCLQTPAIKT